ncbi:hypothetical protein [Streptomyces sp. NPDC051132]|uniref:hypothetical protein n=1 Tax=unclassified Streptomyces TaxID=2593676 RepID=UPI0034430E3A
MRPAPLRLLGTALLPVLCLTACTAGTDPVPDHPATAASPPSGDTPAEKKLAARAQSALDAVTEQGDAMVESGMERVSDGIHTRPDLSTGRPYKLTVVCAGKGDAEIVVTPGKTAAAKPVPCDGSVVFERFTGSTALRIDVRGKTKATGMMAWRINTV